MMTAPITTTAATGSTATAAPTSPAGGNELLNQNVFLKLMVAQLQAQNPLQPSNTNEYINELANLTQLEQVTNLASSSELSGAVRLIGHQVTYKDASGATQTGTVETVQSGSSGATLTIGGTPGISQQSITEVA